jgi:flavin reductase (DIM6/NTAB) family NADH-FMN oxidoreductase RutF
MITAQEYRAVMRNLVSGVTIVTTELDGQPYGMTATSFTSVSLEPMLVQVCLEKDSRTHHAVKGSRDMAINILAAGQEQIARQFAAPGSTGFDNCEIAAGETGLPLIAGAIGHLECRVVQEFEGGDHTIFLAEVAAGKAGEGTPLVHFRGDYQTMDEKGKK